MVEVVSPKKAIKSLPASRQSGGTARLYEIKGPLGPQALKAQQDFLRSKVPWIHMHLRHSNTFWDQRSLGSTRTWGKAILFEIKGSLGPHALEAQQEFLRSKVPWVHTHLSKAILFEIKGPLGPQALEAQQEFLKSKVPWGHTHLRQSKTFWDQKSLGSTRTGGTARLFILYLVLVSTQEGRKLSRHHWKLVDWYVKHQLT